MTEKQPDKAQDSLELKKTGERPIDSNHRDFRYCTSGKTPIGERPPRAEESAQ